MDTFPINVERIDPILWVSDLDRAVRYYTDVLGTRSTKAVARSSGSR